MTRKKRDLRAGDIEPIGFFVDRACETMDFTLGADREIDEAEIPAEFKHLIPLAKRFGISDCGAQLAFIDYLEEEEEDQIEYFLSQIRPYKSAIDQWLQERYQKRLDKWVEGTRIDPGTESEAAFLYTMKMFDILNPLDPETKAMIEERMRLERIDREKREALARSEELMRAKNYKGVVELLSPYADELSKAQSMRLSFAKKRSGDE